MIDITRLDELYAAAIAQADHPAHSDYRDWIHKITDAWPAVAAELTRLREFARYCRDNYDCDSDSHKYDTRCRACEAAKVLDAKTKKVGE